MLISEDFYIEHYGTKGMRWGVRRNPVKAAARARNKELNKAARAKEAKSRDISIERARRKIESGKSDVALAKAKAQYQKDKITKGSYEAKKILREAKAKNTKLHETASQAKSGKETVAVLLTAGALAGIAIGGQAALNKWG